MLDRQENVNRVLRLLMEDVGERWIKMALIDPRSGIYRAVGEATWADLKGQHLIEDAKAGCIFLSGQGWEAGARLAGRDNPETLENLDRICKSIKSGVAGRSSRATGVPVRLGKVCSHTGLSAGFVANVIESGLIESWLKRRGVTWASGFEGKMILVPMDFGLEEH